MILVLGAGGKVGGELVKELTARAVPFRAAYRTREKAAEAARTGVDSVVVEYRQPETLRAVLGGGERLFLVTSPTPELPALEESVVDVARDVGVSRLVKISVWSVEEEGLWFAGLHRGVEERIRASGIPFTFLRPNSFMQNMLMQVESIRSTGAFYLPAGDARVSDVDVRDVARVAAVTLTTEGHENRAYDVSGPEALTYRERAEILSNVLGRQVSYVSPPDDDWKKAVLAAGMPEWLADGLIGFQHHAMAGNGKRVSPAVQEITGRPPASFRQFAEDYAPAFR